MKDAGAKLVWSPQSNLRLYGETTLAAEALDVGVTMGLGADWLPSGSQSLLHEMKVARRELSRQGANPPARRLVEMVTSDAANIAGLGEELGRLREGRPADLVVFEPGWTTPTRTCSTPSPAWVELVMIDGDLPYGRADWLEALTDPADRERLEPLIAWGKRMLLDTSPPRPPPPGIHPGWRSCASAGRRGPAGRSPSSPEKGDCSMLTINLALVSEIEDHDPTDLARVGAALQRQANATCRSGTSATVDASPSWRMCLSVWPMMIVEDVQGAAGNHLDKDGQPFALIEMSDSSCSPPATRCWRCWPTLRQPPGRLDQARAGRSVPGRGLRSIEAASSATP